MPSNTKHKPLITHQRLLEVLHYDPETGLFTWLVNRPAGPNTRRAGDRAGTVSKVSGYVAIGIDGREYYGHRLAHFYMTAAWPKDEIDHRDLDRSNNIWTNLRPATKAEQRFNQSARSDSTTGFKGVTQTPEGRFKAKIRHHGHHIHIGHFDTAEEAHDAYLAKARSIAGDFARGN